MTEEEIHNRPNYGLPASESTAPRIRTNAEMGFPEYTIHKKRKKSTYVKPQSIKQLEIDYKEWHYSKSKYIDVSDGVDFKFSDKNTNELTKSIMGWFKCNGGYATRRNTQGTYSVSLGRYIYSGATKGAEDVDGTLNSINVKIEIKYGKDRQRPAQIEYQKMIEGAGGKYIIVKNYDGFLKQIRAIYGQ